MERVTGIEPASPAWKAGALAIELHPQLLNIFAYVRSLKYYHLSGRDAGIRTLGLLVPNQAR